MISELKFLTIFHQPFSVSVIESVIQRGKDPIVIIK